ncbi:MAG: PAS domain S-box protein [Acidobacteria bacterium]|nr:PAS domain S-box protein [Acidobacteriota bacterium]
MNKVRKTKAKIGGKPPRAASQTAAKRSGQKCEELFQKVFTFSNDAIFIIDPASDQILEANPSACRMLGYSCEELLATPVSSVHPNEMPRLLAFTQSVIDRGSGWTDQLTCLTMNGETLPAEISASVIEFDGRNCVIAMVRNVSQRRQAQEALRKARDELEARVEERTAELSQAHATLKEEISERKRAEAALQESEARFRTLVEHAPEIILVLDADTGRFVDFNENAVRFFGLEREPLLKLGPLETSPPSAPDGRTASEFALEKIQEALDGSTPVFEWIHRNAAGEEIPCEVRLMRLPAAGRNLIRGSITDISERKRAEAALRRYAKRLEILQEIDRAILAAGSSGEIALAALRRIRQLIPSRRASVMELDRETGEGLLLAVHSGDVLKLMTGVRLPIRLFGELDALRQGEPHTVEDAATEPDDPFFKVLKSEGLRSWMNVPLISQGELIGTLNLGWERTGPIAPEHIEVAREVANSLAIAISQARLLEQVQRHATEVEQRVAERTAELEAFSYSVSHDLRTPLLTIDGFSRMLVEDYTQCLDEEGRRLLRIICQNSQSMGRLIDDLLSFSRLGRQEMRLVEIEMSELAGAVFAELRELEPERKIEFRLQPLSSSWGDPPMIRQVFFNLFSNALKFTGAKETVIIEAGAMIEEQRNIYFVRDNGVGFDMKYSDKMFGVFQRLHAEDQFAGAGVGLAFVQRIIQRHGGRVWAEGAVNVGATIYFALPHRRKI